MRNRFVIVTLATIVALLGFFSVVSAEKPPFDEFTQDQTQPLKGVAANHYPVELVGQILFPAMNVVVVQGNYAYTPNGFGLLVVDVSNPANVSILKQLYIERGARSRPIDVSGNYVCILTMGDGNFTVVDVSNPSSPTIVGACPLDVYGTDLHIVDQIAYVTSYDGFFAVDISQPAAPVVLDGLPQDGGWKCQIAGDYAYIAASTSIKIVDISDPSNLQLVGNYTDMTKPYSFALNGNILYFVDTGHGVKALDISNPIAPVLLGEFALENAGVIRCSGNYVYVSWGQNGPAYVLDFTDPSLPIEIGRMSNDTWGLTQADNRLYFYESDRMHIWDISTPANPMSSGNFRLSGSGIYAWNLAITGNIAAVSFSDLYLIDISNPAAPTVLSTYRPSGYMSEEVAAEGNFVYLADGAALNVLDITDPVHPALIARLMLGYGATYLDVEGNLAVTGSSDCMNTIDITDPYNPTLLKHFTSSDLFVTNTVRLFDKRAYVSVVGDDHDIMVIVDLSDPLNPQVISRYDSPYFGGSDGKIGAMNDTAYLRGGFGTLEILDCTDAAHVRKLGECILPGGSEFVRLGDFLFVSNNLLSIIDLYNPGFPQVVSSYQPNKEGSSLAISGEYIYTMGAGHFTILRALEPHFLIGDADASESVDISDAVFLISYIFAGGQVPLPFRQGDANCDREVDISDVVHMIGFIFGGGPAPCGK